MHWALTQKNPILTQNITTVLFSWILLFQDGLFLTPCFMPVMLKQIFNSLGMLVRSASLVSKGLSSQLERWKEMSFIHKEKSNSLQDLKLHIHQTGQGLGTNSFSERKTAATLCALGNIWGKKKQNPPPPNRPEHKMNSQISWKKVLPKTSKPCLGDCAT